MWVGGFGESAVFTNQLELSDIQWAHSKSIFESAVVERPADADYGAFVDSAAGSCATAHVLQDRGRAQQLQLSSIPHQG